MMRWRLRWPITLTSPWRATICPLPIPIFSAPKLAAHSLESIRVSFQILPVEVKAELEPGSREPEQAAQQLALVEQVLALAVLWVPQAARDLSPTALTP